MTNMCNISSSVLCADELIVIVGLILVASMGDHTVKFDVSVNPEKVEKVLVPVYICWSVFDRHELAEGEFLLKIDELKVKATGRLYALKDCERVNNGTDTTGR